MKKFLVLYFVKDSDIEKINKITSKEQEKEMKAWELWGEKYSNNIVDFWNPVGVTKKLSNSWVSQGEHKTIGYGIMQANCKDEMYEVLKSNPHLSWNNEATIEVSEINEMM